MLYDQIKLSHEKNILYADPSVYGNFDKTSYSYDENGVINRYSFTFGFQYILYPEDSNIVEDHMKNTVVRSLSTFIFQDISKMVGEARDAILCNDREEVLKTLNKINDYITYDFAQGLLKRGI